MNLFYHYLLYEQIIKIMNVDLSNERYYIRLSRDIFIFSYLCGGINFSDMAYLTGKNVIESRLMYQRKKTHKQICFPLNDNALRIVETYSNSCRNQYKTQLIISPMRLTARNSDTKLKLLTLRGKKVKRQKNIIFTR